MKTSAFVSLNHISYEMLLVSIIQFSRYNHAAIP
eukprot:COSAG01_NODE_64212_length_277_cov_0.870787_1_plen_33_part_01